MAYVIADNIISPLGDSTESNYQALKESRSGLREYSASELHIPQDYIVSLLSDGQLKHCGDMNACGTTKKLSRFELIALASAHKAIDKAGINVSENDVVFILSSTKGGIEEMKHQDDVYPSLSESARLLATLLGFKTQPIVVCNACISGVSALILAQRLLDMCTFRHAVVCGADSPSRFIISGFQSLKALSTEQCRPFDMERFGLNLGEAAATIVLSIDQKEDATWELTNGTIRNDAFHITTPSKTGDGLSNALQQTLRGLDAEQIALVNVHGTATLFNDQMESVAIEKSGLSAVPANALKGYFGHTLGAAGVLETILCMKQIDDHTILGTHGFTELGVSGKVDVSANHRTTDKTCFVKLISGFGGCNATISGIKTDKKKGIGNVPDKKHDTSHASINKGIKLQKRHTINIRPNEAVVDGKALVLPKVNKETEEAVKDSAKDFLTKLYKHYIGDYPKFYKMDELSRLGFVASELLLQAERAEKGNYSEEETQSDIKMRKDRAVLLFNHSSSILADRKYLKTIEGDDCFPSPSVFVYTLPNIVIGEIAIRNGYQGETSFYIIPEKSKTLMDDIILASLQDEETKDVLAGWIDYDSHDNYEAEMSILNRY